MTHCTVHAIGAGGWGSKLTYETFTFRGGEQHVRLAPSIHDVSVKYLLQARLHSTAAIMELLLLTDALRRRHPDAALHLECRYLPYARQDRVCASGEALALDVMCQLLRSQRYASITVWDPHSDVALALLGPTVRVRTQAELAAGCCTDPTTVLVAPDAGAARKCWELAQRVQRPLLQATKHRDPRTGAITATSVPGTCDPAARYLLVDDICDGGRTFLELAHTLRAAGAQRVELYVTHGLFSRGLEPLLAPGVLDWVYCSNPFDLSLTNPNYTVLQP